MVDARAKHLRLLRRRLSGARRWSALAGVFGGASAILVPYAGLGLPDAAWVAGTGGAVVLALWRWREYREVAALPVPQPTDPAEAASAMRRKIVAAVSSFPAGQTAIDEVRRQRSRMRYRGLAVAPLWQRLDRAALTLAGIADRLDGVAAGPRLEAATAEHTLRDLVERTASVERALRIAPEGSCESLGAAHAELMGQLSEGVTAYEHLVAAAAGYIAEDGRSGAKYLDSATMRLTDATDLLRGVSAGLAELRRVQMPPRPADHGL
jgi:hypothetical protein